MHTTVIDGLLFHNRPWLISASWFVIADDIILGAGDFITSVSADYRSTCAAELCRCLAAMQSVGYLFTNSNSSVKINLGITTDCLSVIHALNKQQKVISMNTDLHLNAYELAILRSKRFKSLKCIKVEDHKDGIYKLEELTLIEQLNVKCDARAKALIQNTTDNTVILFLLQLSSAYVTNKDSQLVLNYPKDILRQAHLSHCKEHLSRTLRVAGISKAD